jgi:uncharacterized protein YcbK (DUF882 family)
MPHRFTFFRDSELACRCGDCDGGAWSMSARFMHRIVDMRRKLDFPFVVSSAYRCPAHNAAVSTTGIAGPHTTGRALDLRVYGHRAFAIVGIAKQYGMTGIGIQQKGPRNVRMVHLDDLGDVETQGPRPWVWTY